MPSANYSRLDLASEQLDVALEIFLSERSYVSALSLAGAAEEVFGATLSLRGDENALSYEYSLLVPVEAYLRRQAKRSWRDFRDGKNFVRNAAKHLDRTGQVDVEADLRSEALWLLVRACDNYRRLSLPVTSRMLDFDDWFLKHVVGVDESLD
jgi:hypothetical protein